MICDSCKQKKATVHLTEIVDEQMTELHLCEDCAREKSMQMEQQFGLADLLAGLTDFGKQFKGAEQAQLSCSNCGLSYDDFRKLGRLGCSECYSAFREQLAILLKKIHGSSQHCGSSPVKVEKVPKVKSEWLQELKDLLKKAIAAENFERAAELRDRIRTLEEKGKK